jgi:flagellar basal-body rod modification protein FlgD
MINPSDTTAKSSNDYLEHIRQKIGQGHSDKAESRSAKKELGKDDFIKLMSVQLKHQDPMSPLKNEEMAAQLAQFSGLEQMQNVNRNLEKMSGAGEMRDSMQAASLIGKRVVTDAAKFKLTEDRKVDLNFELPGDIEQGKISVFDSKGAIVRDLLIDRMDKGKQSVKWDGRNEKGTFADLGEYTFKISAQNKLGQKVEAVTNTTGIVSGIEFDKGKAVLLVGSERIYMDVVSRIENIDAKPATPKVDATNPAATMPGQLAAGDALPKADESAGWPSQMSAPDKEASLESSKEVAKDSTTEELANKPMKIEEDDNFSDDVAENNSLGLAGAALWNPALNQEKSTL